MNIDQALREFGVQDDTLSSEEKDFLDVNGYLPLENILTQEQIAKIDSSVGRTSSVRGRGRR